MIINHVSQEPIHFPDFFVISHKNFSKPHHLWEGGGWSPKNRKHDFEITVDPKGPPCGSTFWLGFETPDLYGRAWGHAHFWAHTRPKKSKMIDKA